MPMDACDSDLAHLTACVLLTCSLAERCSYRFSPYLTAYLPRLTGPPSPVERREELVDLHLDCAAVDAQESSTSLEASGRCS